MTALYLDTTPPPVDMPKVAAEARLSDSADSWPREVHKELLRECPYLGAYDVSPQLTKVDAEQGYGLGFVRVSSKSATMPLGPGSDAVMKSQGVRAIRVPVIIKNKKLQPMDVFLGDKGIYPMSDVRVRAALFRPQVFDSVKSGPGDTSIYDQLYPPSSRQSGGGGGQVSSVSQTKLGSTKPTFLLEAISSTITADDVARIKLAMSEDPQLVRALVHNDSTRPFIETIVSLTPVTTQDVTKVASMIARPTIFQVERLNDSYLLKTADDTAFDPQVTEVDRNTAVEIAGKDLVEQADNFGAGTVTMNPVVHDDSIEDEEIGPITSFGEYRVKTPDGQEYLGWVFPTVLDFDGTSLPFMLFTNGAVSAIQESIVGSFVGKGVNIIRGKPEGYGFFYRVTTSGGVIAFQPLEIASSFSDESGSGFLGETMMAEPVKIVFSAEVHAPVHLEGTTYVLPSDVRWAPLGKKMTTKLIRDATEFIKTAMVRASMNMVRVISDGHTWSFNGPPLEKVAYRWREGLGGADAAFMASALGMSNELALKTLIKSARERDAVFVPNCRAIGSPGVKLAAARQRAKSLWDAVPRRRSLLKEAAALDDVTTIDKILSLGFISPENAQIFVSWLPDLEEALQKLASLLLAARLGQEDIPEQASKSAMLQLEEVIMGLKKLMFRKDGK